MQKPRNWFLGVNKLRGQNMPVKENLAKSRVTGPVALYRGGGFGPCPFLHDLLPLFPWRDSKNYVANLPRCIGGYSGYAG